MTNLNIVELIEKIPITRLSNSCQNKLLSRIKSKFTNKDQQLFIASFYSYLNYNSTRDFVIDLDNVWKWLGFQQKVNAKRLLEKYFQVDVDYKTGSISSDEVSEERKHGGHNKETFIMTINAFKRLCLKAGTKKADEIHDYYIKLEETLHEVVNEEGNELKLQLDQLKSQMVKTEQNSKATINSLKKEKEQEKQNILLREFGNAGALVYIIKVKSYESGEYIVKIGESRKGVLARYNEHKSKYEEVCLMDCFLVKKSKDFESFLHNHPDIRINQVKDLQGHENENELFLVGKNMSYNILLNIVKTNIQRFNDMDYEKIFCEIEIIKNLLTNQSDGQTNHFITEPQNHPSNEIINQLFEKMTVLEKSNQELEKSNKEILEKLNKMQTKTTTGFETPLITVGPRLQKINPETLQLVKVYESVSECIRENPQNKRPSINNSVKFNTIYNGFRWMFVDRNADPNIIVDIEPTKKVRTQTLGYVAKLNTNKNEILNVYLDRKTAAIQNGYSASALDNPMKNGIIANGYYYVLYEKCDHTIKTKFEEQHNNGKSPILYKDGVGQYDASNQLIQEFICKYDVLRKLHMSDKTMAKALDKEVAYNGFYYRSIGSKLSVFPK